MCLCAANVMHVSDLMTVVIPIMHLSLSLSGSHDLENGEIVCDGCKHAADHFCG